MSELLHWYMDDTVYPWNNPYEIPMLDETMQADGIIGRFYLWGNNARSRTIPGSTYAFYCKDYKFSALIKHPDGIPRTGCAAIIEPNFSTSSRMPFPVGLYGIYLKRKIARYAQTHGVKVIVDLTVHPKFLDLNLNGVPEGWRSYAARATEDFGTDYLDLCYETAQQHSGLAHPAFFVYGGGKKIEQHCREQYWDWEPEHMSRIRDRIKTWGHVLVGADAQL